MKRKKRNPKLEAAVQRLRKEAESLAEGAETWKKLTFLTDSIETPKKALQYKELLKKKRRTNLKQYGMDIEKISSTTCAYTKCKHTVKHSYQLFTSYM